MTTSGGSSGGSSSSSSGGSNYVPRPRPQSEAPRGAYLGTTSNGSSLVSNGDSTGTLVGGSGQDNKGGSPGDRISLVSGAGVSAPRPVATGRSIASSGGGGTVGTTVNQTPAAGAGTSSPAKDGPENTSITATPRSDFSVVLAGQTGRRPDRTPSRSNNFVSLIGKAGGLGRRSSDAKRTLIGGA